MGISRKQEAFAWPPRCLLNFYAVEKRGLRLYRSTAYRLFDMADVVDEMLGSFQSGIIYFGLSCKSKKWPTWDEDSLQQIEDLIGYDLCFDDEFEVRIERATKALDLPCTEEFCWKLYIERT